MDYSPWGCKELDMTETTEHTQATLFWSVFEKELYIGRIFNTDMNRDGERSV